MSDQCTYIKKCRAMPALLWVVQKSLSLVRNGGLAPNLQCYGDPLSSIGLLEDTDLFLKTRPFHDFCAGPLWVINKPKNFDFIHQTVSRWEARAGWSQDQQALLLQKLPLFCRRGAWVRGSLIPRPLSYGGQEVQRLTSVIWGRGRSVKFNMHKISNMSIAFIEQTMPTFMHNMPTCMHNMPMFIHNMPTCMHNMSSYIHNIPYIIVQAQHTNMTHVHTTCQHESTAYQHPICSVTCSCAGTICMYEVHAHYSHLAQPKIKVHR